MERGLKHPKRNSNAMSYSAITIALIALLFSIFLTIKREPSSTSDELAQETAMERIKRTGTLRVGYGGFPPYTIVDLSEANEEDQLQGFCIDMVKEIASRAEPPLKIEWQKLSWENFNADMQSGRFDFLADGVFATIPKAVDFNFTDPFSYFGLCVAVVRIDDTRFETFEDLNRSDITISYAEGYISGDYAKTRLDKPSFRSVQVGNDAFIQLDDVITGKADVAVQDVPTVVQYVRNHSNQVKALWLDNPPTQVAGSFVTRREDLDLLQFLNTSIEILRTDGTLSRLDEKWNSLGYFEKRMMERGTGIKEE